jgi:hypothetical protein
MVHHDSGKRKPYLISHENYSDAQFYWVAVRWRNVTNTRLEEKYSYRRIEEIIL